MKKVTVRLDDELHRKVRIRGIETGEPLQQMIVRLLREVVRSRPSRRKEAKKRR